MVKYVMSFLISFKNFCKNDVNILKQADVSEYVEEGEQQEQRYFYYFKPNEDLKKICNISCIFPGSKTMLKSQVSITCWSEIVKIYNQKNDVALKTVLYDGKIWAAFSIHHNVEDFDIEQLKSIYPLNLEIQFNEDIKSVLPRTQTEKIGIYCYRKTYENHHETNGWFKPLYEVEVQQKNHQLKGGSPKSTSAKSKNFQSNQTSDRSNKSSFNTKKKIVDADLYKNVNQKHLVMLIKAVQSPIPADNISLPGSSSSGCSLILPVSYLFSDKEVWILKNSKPLSTNIEDIYVFLTAYSFLDEAMRMYFNPFTIRLQALQNLPIEELKIEGIKKVCAEYELLPIIPKTRTKYQDISPSRNNLYFKDFKIFLTDEFNPLSVMSTIQSKKLLVRVLGLKDSPKPVKSVRSEVYGSDLYDDRLSSCIKVKVQSQNLIKSKSSITRASEKNGNAILRTNGIKTKSNMKLHKGESMKSLDSDDTYLGESNVLLGTAQIDLSPLVFGNCCIFAHEEISSLPIIISTQEKNEKEKKFLDQFNITEAHIDKNKYEQGILRNRSLFQNNTMVKLSVKCRFLLKPEVLKDSHFLQESFSRTIAIFVDKNCAAHTLKKILKSNSEALLKMKNYNIPLVPIRNIYEVETLPLLRYPYLQYEQEIYSTETYEVMLEENHSGSQENENLESWFTGFCIDCINMVLMYFEGPTINVFPYVLSELVKVNSDQGRILYSSDLIYDSRVYGAFKELGGIYCIVMKNTIENLIKKGTLCHDTAIPDPALKALKSISRLLKCKTLLEGVQNGYLPQPEQLLSFDIEFGLPLCLER